MLSRTGIGLGAALAVFLIALPARAEWSSQTLRLHPGWNAVHIEVQPHVKDIESVFDGIPVNSVWSWVKQSDTARFLHDPSSLVPEMPDWLVYFPEEHPKAFLSDLYAVHGGRCYLVDLAGEDDVSLQLEGKSVVRTHEWLPNAFNLVGFHLDDKSNSTFEEFFRYDGALAGSAIFRTGSGGKNEKVMVPAEETLRPGEAYWVYCNGESTYDGPFSVGFEDRDGLVFGGKIQQQSLKLTNESAHPKTITLQVLPSTRPAAKGVNEDLDPLAGGVALSYKQLLDWEEMPGELSFTLDPNATRRIDLAVRRTDMDDLGNPDAVFESLVAMSDNEGSKFVIPVSSKGVASPTGLWVGTVTLDAVSEAGNPQDSVTPTAATSKFRFRLIVHVDENSEANLLQHVTLMYLQPTFIPDPDNPGEEIEDTPGRYVLLTDDSLIPNYEGMSVRDGKIVGRRISSPVFAFPHGVHEVALTGSVDATLETAAAIQLPFDDPLNPFVHRYHPDHDNLDERYSSTLPEGRESFDFSRAIQLEFTATDPNEQDLPAWGDELIGGIYHETISGVHQQDIHVQGTFQLTKVTSVSELNDGQ